MYGVDSLPTPYYEERLRTDHAARLAKQQSLHLAPQQSSSSIEQQRAAHAPHCTAAKSNMPCPQNLTQALLQRPPLSRPVSSGVMGNIFQGFVRQKEGRSGSTTPTKEGSVTPPPGPIGAQDGRLTREEYEAWMRERRRQTETGMMPAFYH